MHEERDGAVGRAGYLRENGTTAESKVWRWLRGRKLIGWKCRRQYPIGTYILDLRSVRSGVRLCFGRAPHPDPLPEGEGRGEGLLLSTQGQLEERFRMHEKRAGAIGRARYLRENRTTAEAKVWRWLRGRKLIGWKFRRQYPIGSYILDLRSVRSGGSLCFGRAPPPPP